MEIEQAFVDNQNNVPENEWKKHRGVKVAN